MTLVKVNQRALEVLLQFLKWNENDIDFFQDSGWQDYFSNFKEGDIFEGDYLITPTIVDGKLYIRHIDGLKSIYTYKFKDRDGILVPTFKSSKALGYDFLFTPSVKLESLRKKIFKDFRIMIEELNSIVMEASMDQIRNQVEDILIRHTYLSSPIIMSFLKVAPTLIKHSTEVSLLVIDDINVTAHLGGGIRRTDIIIDMIKDDVARISHNERIDDIIWSLFHPYFEEDIENMESQPIYMIEQYKLSDVETDIERVETNIIDGSIFYYLEAIMTMMHYPKLKQEMRTRTDYLKLFAENIDDLKYLRYPISILGYKMKDIQLGSYQADYENKLVRRTARFQDIDDSGIELNSSDQEYNYKSLFLYRKRRKEELMNQHISNILTNYFGRKIGLDTWYSISEIEGNDNFATITVNKEILTIPTQIATNIKNIKNSSYLNDAEESFDLSGTLSKTKNKYIKIKGVEFKAYDIARIFYNTPLANEIVLTSEEYNPYWLTLADVKLMKEFVEGRIMPYIYYIKLSKTAYKNMSEKYTFLDIYSRSHAKIIDRSYVLGKNVCQYLRQLRLDKSVDRYPDHNVIELSNFLTIF